MSITPPVASLISPTPAVFGNDERIQHGCERVEHWACCFEQGREIADRAPAHRLVRGQSDQKRRLAEPAPGPEHHPFGVEDHSRHARLDRVQPRSFRQRNSPRWRWRSPRKSVWIERRIQAPDHQARRSHGRCGASGAVYEAGVALVFPTPDNLEDIAFRRARARKPGFPAGGEIRGDDDGRDPAHRAVFDLHLPDSAQCGGDAHDRVFPVSAARRIRRSSTSPSSSAARAFRNACMAVIMALP